VLPTVGGLLVGLRPDLMGWKLVKRERTEENGTEIRKMILNIAYITENEYKTLTATAHCH